MHFGVRAYSGTARFVPTVPLDRTLNGNEPDPVHLDALSAAGVEWELLNAAEAAGRYDVTVPPDFHVLSQPLAGVVGAA